MAIVRGTKGDDPYIGGTDDADVIHGLGGDDLIYGLAGDDRIYGDGGNDYLSDSDGRNEIWGGKGNDEILFARGFGRGGLGNDTLVVFGGGWAGGGAGDDTLTGTGYLCGDALPGGDTRIAGNDTLSMYADADTVRANGGLGNDAFLVWLDGGAGIAIIEDFTRGDDKLRVTLAPPSDVETDLFATLDANQNGVLEWSDSLSGGGVYVDAASNTMFLINGPAGVIVHGATEISQADWVT